MLSLSKNMVETTFKKRLVGILRCFIHFIHFGTLKPFAEVIIDISVQVWFSI